MLKFRLLTKAKCTNYVIVKSSLRMRLYLQSIFLRTLVLSKLWVCG